MSFLSYFKKKKKYRHKDKITEFKPKEDLPVEKNTTSFFDEKQITAIEKINDILSRNDSFVLFVHKNADPDSLCSAIVLSSILKEDGKKTKIVALEKINNQSKRIIDHYPYPISYQYDYTEKNKDVFILVDAPDFTCINPSIQIPAEKEIIIIDHHKESNGKNKNAVKLTDEDKTSTAILVYSLMKFLNYEMTKERAVFLLLGIVADTGFLRQAKHIDFIALAQLTEHCSIKKIMSLLNKEKDKTERLENLKALLRLKVHQFDDIFVGYTYTGSFGTSIALTIMYAGCDISFAETRKKNNISLSVRSRKHIENKVDLAVFCSNLAKKYKKYNATGGGHKTAASMQLTLPDKNNLYLEKEIINSLKNKLRTKSKIIKI
ncbi:MAG: DHH family phosphoesterase [Candidatus Aenigmarchaeota archaeon]|nr:DHH family phosphoesterase [Candidatus Aenigmarchaeota archaeon]